MPQSQQQGSQGSGFNDFFQGELPKKLGIMLVRMLLCCDPDFQVVGELEFNKQGTMVLPCLALHRLPCLLSCGTYSVTCNPAEWGNTI